MTDELPRPPREPREPQDPRPRRDEDDGPETPTDEPAPVPIDEPRPSREPYVVRGDDPPGATHAGHVVLLALLAVVSSGCQAIADIFQAGVWAGAILIVLVLAVVGFIAAKIRRL